MLQVLSDSSDPTHHQTLIYVDNVALSSLIVHFHCVFLFLPTREFCSLPVVFLCFIPAVLLLVLIATDDYCIIVETSGFHILS